MTATVIPRKPRKLRGHVSLCEQASDPDRFCAKATALQWREFPE